MDNPSCFVPILSSHLGFLASAPHRYWSTAYSMPARLLLVGTVRPLRVPGRLNPDTH